VQGREVNLAAAPANSGRLKWSRPGCVAPSHAPIGRMACMGFGKSPICFQEQYPEDNCVRSRITYLQGALTALLPQIRASSRSLNDMVCGSYNV
jgi:hypothetical protein